MTLNSELRQGLDANARLQSAATPDGTVIVGEGRVVVICIPTFDELAFVYNPLLGNLPPDFVGYTYSPGVRTNQLFGPEERALELLAFMNRHRIRRAHLVGWSDSAVAMSAFASRHSDRVISRSYLQMPDRYKLPGLLHPLGKLYLGTPISSLVPAWAARSVVARLLGGGKISARDLSSEIHNMKNLTGTLKHSILPCILHEVTHERSTIPTLVMGGDNDWWIPARSIANLADSLGVAPVLVPGGDHFLPWTSRAEVTPIVLDHLQRVNPVQ